MTESEQDNLFRILEKLVEYGKPVSKTKMGFELDRGAFLCRQHEMNELCSLGYVNKTPFDTYEPTALGIEAAAPLMQKTPSKFTKAVQKLTDAKICFSAGTIKPVEYGARRMTALGDALSALASEFGVTLQAPLQIDANGEFSIMAMPTGGASPAYGAGEFGSEFAKLLNVHSPRTGVNPRATMKSRSGWCQMNHFEVEKMILSHQLKRDDVENAGPKPKKMRP